MTRSAASGAGLPPPTRSIGLMLGLGIIFVPFIFGWCTLRRGHTLASRVLAFGWMIVVVVAIGADQQSSP